MSSMKPREPSPTEGGSETKPGASPTSTAEPTTDDHRLNPQRLKQIAREAKMIVQRDKTMADLKRIASGE